MALCRVTGTLYVPSGEPAASYVLYLTRLNKSVIADYNGSVVPEVVRVRVGRDGSVDFEIITGEYYGIARPCGSVDGFSFSFAVPDAATAAFEDCIDAIAPPSPPPEWLQRVEQAVADAEAAAATAGYVAQGLSGALDAINRIEEGTRLVDGSRRVVSIGPDGGEPYGDVIRLEADGLLVKHSQRTQDSTLADGRVVLGEVKANGFRDLVSIEGISGALVEVSPDSGLNFKVAEGFWDQAPSSIIGAGWGQAGNRGIQALDQFTNEDGVDFPIAIVSGSTRKAMIFSVYGQSNADVTEMDDALIWGAPPMPHHIFMLNDVSGARGGLRGYIGVPSPSGVKRLIPAREDAVTVSGKHVQSYATAAAARLNVLIGSTYHTFAVRSSAVGGQKLVGDTPGAGIWKDSNGDYVQSWLNWTSDLKYMHDLLVQQGYDVEAVHICFTHQEADWETARATYTSQLESMKSERNAIIATDMPGIPVRWFCDQASGSGLRSPGYRGGAWQSRLSIVDVTDADSSMTMVMPRYHMRFGFNGGVRETIHHAHYDRILQGETYAYAMREIMEGRAWRCPRMTAATVSGNAVTVTFDSLLPIVIDPTFCKVRPDMGFKIGDGSIAVQSVTQTGQRQVTIQCDASPAGQLLAYAWREQDAQDVSDEWAISTGAIRDAFMAPSMFLGGERILRPALAYTLQL